jgi:hypothetical protein
MGFMASRALLSAVELGIFTGLGRTGPQTLSELESSFGLHHRSSADFLDFLVSIALLNREGNGPAARYSNSVNASVFLDKASPGYMGGILVMCAERLYASWNGLTDSLKTGQRKSEGSTDDDLFKALYADKARLRVFLEAMSGIQKGNFLALVEIFDFAGKVVVDVGGCEGQFTRTVAHRHPTCTAINYDLPEVCEIASEKLAGIPNAKVVSGDFFKDDAFPKADIVVMGNILHDWDETTKRMLFRKAFQALPAGGAFIAIESIIDDDRRVHTQGLLMSLNMLIETSGGFDYTFAQFQTWGREAGFTRFEKHALAGPMSAVIAFK